MILGIISGNSHPEMGYLLSKYLQVPIDKVVCWQKKNRTIEVISEALLHREEIFIIGTLGLDHIHLNDFLIELMFIINTCKHRSKAKLTAGNIQ